MKIIEEFTDKDSENKTRTYCRLECPNCKGIFTRHKRLIKSEYCSRKCKSEKEIKVTLTCATCDLSFTRTPSKTKSASNNVHFCCRKCKDEGQKSIKEIQPDHYGTADEPYRRKALNHYKHICNRCSYSNFLALEVHHLDRNKENNDLTNLEILCANCHTIAHKLDYK